MQTPQLARRISIVSVWMAALAYLAAPDGLLAMGGRANLEKQSAYPVYQMPRPPVMDGKGGDESFWKHIPEESGFFVLRKGMAAQSRTSFRAACTENAFYITGTCLQPRADDKSIPAVNSDNDCMELYIVPQNGEPQKIFSLNPKAEKTPPKNWNLKTAVSPDVWTFEAEIPFGEIMRPPAGVKWGVNLFRYISNPEEKTTWSAQIANLYDLKNYRSFEFAGCPPQETKIFWEKTAAQQVSAVNRGSDLPDYPVYQGARSPAMDGKAGDEGFWGNIPEESGFYVIGKGMDSKNRTFFRAAWTEKALYITGTCFQPDANSAVVSAATPPDQIWASDCIELQVAVPPDNRKTVLVFNRQGEQNSSGWNLKTTMSGNAWTFEVEIPWDILKTKPAHGAKWKVNLCRHIFCPGENIAWTPDGRAFADGRYYRSFEFAANPPPAGKNTPLLSKTYAPEPVKTGPAEKFDPTADKSWKLVWGDEFDGDTLDQSKWKYANVEGTLLGNFGILKHNYLYLDGKGNAVVKFDIDKETGRRCSAGIRSKKLFRFGYFEARVKFEKEPGWWTGFWLQEGGVGPGPLLGGAEIDIFETAPGKQSNILLLIGGNYHVGYNGRFPKSFGEPQLPNKRVDNRDEFHVVSAKWTPWEIVYYLDGVERHKCTAEEYAMNLGALDVRIDGCLADAYFVGDIKKAKLPDYYLIDYVRVYQRVGDEDKTPVLAWTQTPFIFQKENAKLEFAAKILNPGKSRNNDKTRAKIEKVCLFGDGYLLETKTTPPYKFEVTLNYEHYYKLNLKTAPGIIPYFGPNTNMASGINPFLGPNVFTIAALNDNGLVGYTEPVVIITKKDQLSAPYEGAPQVIPGIVSLKKFDEGGDNVAYYNARLDKDDMQALRLNKKDIDDSACLFFPGEWMNFTIDVQKPGKYSATMSYVLNYHYMNEGDENRIVKLFMDGQPLSDMALPYTKSGFENFETKGLNIPAGRHVLTILFIGGYITLRHMDFKVE